MAITHVGKLGEVVYVDPDDARGPWTVQFPTSPSNNARFTIAPTSASNTVVFLESTDKTILFDITQLDASTWPLKMDGGTYEFVFNAGLGAGVWTPKAIDWNAFIFGRNLVSYFPFKAMAIEFTGDLSITHSYNVAPPVRNPSTGIYEIDLSQTAYLGIDIADYATPTLTVFAPGTAEGAYAQFEDFTDATTMVVSVKEFYLQGQNLRIQNYNLGPTETLWIMLLMNYTDSEFDQLPATPRS